MSTVLAEKIEKQGTFQLFGDLLKIKEGVDEIVETYGEMMDGNESLTEGQKQELEMFRSILDESFDWNDQLERIPCKKNGTFYKNRRSVLVEGHSFRWVDEDSYGERGPRISIKTISDTEAVLEFDDRAIIHKY